MNFKRIEIAGFKSFADPLKVEFNDGITAIVGPNGCGKSNVADAIRWVLGEQSAKILRGSSMQDVIFKGSMKRKSLSYCEVSLVFDNTNRMFNTSYDEVIFTRKLYRNGTSEYLLNRNIVRKQDITDLLHDSGIGKEGYSIIGQGRVEQIINSKPEDRRGIFEEAAGISKYKQRKLESERRLERVRGDLVRAGDILSEIEKQVGPLKKQSEDAKAYFELKEALKYNEVNAYIHSYENASETKSKITSVIEGLDQELNLRNNELEKVSKQYNINLEKMQNFDADIKLMNEKILDASLALQRFTSDNAIIKERINFLNEQIERSQGVVSKNSLDIEVANKQILEGNARLEKLNKLLVSLHNNESDLKDKYLSVLDELAQSEGESEEANKTVIDALEKLSSIKANLSKLTTEKDVLAEQIEKNSQKLKLFNQNIGLNNAELAKINESTNQVDSNIIRLENIIQSSQKSLTDISFKIKLTEQNLAEQKTKLQVSKNRCALLREMQADFEGYAGSVKRLLQDASTNGQLSKNIIGVVAKLIKVPAKYEVAIEMALGNSIQNVVTHNEDGAKQLINYLKQNKYGRATFLPITSVKPRSLDKSFTGILNENGVCGIAKELIEYDKELEKIFSSLLGSIVICETLENAVNLAKRTNYAFRIVTLEGDVINPAGSLTGGSKKNEASNLLSRDREIEKLNADIEEFSKQISSSQHNLDNLNTEYNNINENLKQSTIELNKIKIEYASVFEKRAHFEEIIASLDNEINEITKSNEQAQIRINFIEREISSIDELENTINNTRISAGEASKAKNILFENLKEQRDKYNADVSNVRVQIASTEAKIEGDNTELERLTQLVEQLSKQNDIEREAIDKNKKAINSMLASMETGASLSKINKQQEILEVTRLKVEKTEENKRNIQASMTTLDEERNNLMDRIATLTKKRMTQEVLLQKVDSDLQVMQDKIYEDYELTYDLCLQFKANEFNITEGYSQIGKLKKEIAKLGSINPNAIEEYKSVCERYEKLNDEMQDMLKSESEIKETIDLISKDMLSIFNEKFDLINKNFGKIFSELFGGGTARLELVPIDDDPLNDGVEIIPEQPGKKLPMNLMSGGEKALTAIAILFAILRLRPMPFCLLDEIEAALDDENIRRFATYLKRFSKETQFIVITHRKPTMELADSLYGVTMDDECVSRIITINLAEAVKNSSLDK